MATILLQYFCKDMLVMLLFVLICLCLTISEHQQPSYVDMKRYILKGEQATWPRLPMIRHAMGIGNCSRVCSKRWPYMLGPRASVALAHSKRLEDAMEKGTWAEKIKERVPKPNNNRRGGV